MRIWLAATRRLARTYGRSGAIGAGSIGPRLRPIVLTELSGLMPQRLTAARHAVTLASDQLCFVAATAAILCFAIYLQELVKFVIYWHFYGSYCGPCHLKQ